MKKNDIIEAIYSETGMKKEESIRIVETIFEIIREELARGNDVMISGFGKWTVRNKKARIGRNPHTGEPMLITGRKSVTFRNSLKLKNELNGK